MKIAIISGKYKLGERLPSVRDFAIEIKANPNTAQRAYSELEAEGLVITQRTNGKFVTEDIKLVNKMKEEIAKQNLMKFIDSMTQLGFSKDEIKEYLGMPLHAELPYDIALLDIDSYTGVINFGINNSDRNYFVTGFDLYSLKRGLEILSGLTEILNLTKVLFSKTATREDDDYLNYLSLGYKIVWNDEIIYFPFEVGDQSVIVENQRVAKIKFKKLSAQYKEALIYIVEQILDQNEYAKMKKIFKQLERGV